MKSRTLPFLRPSIAACAALTVSTYAASDIWIDGTEGNYSDPNNWVGLSVPNGADQTAEVNGAGSIVNFGPDDTVDLLSLGMAIPGTGATPVFNQTGGTLSVGSLLFGGEGESRNPTFNLSGGTLNISTAFTWGWGKNAKFNVSGGTANYAGSALNLGKNGGSGTIEISSGTFNHTGTGGQIRFGDSGTSTGNLVMSGGVFNTASNQIRFGAGGNTTGNGTLSGDAEFNALGVSGERTVFLGNNSGTGNFTMSDSSRFNAPDYVFVVAQFGDKTSTLTLSDDAVLTVSSVVVGNFNSASPANGVINLNGGAIVAGSIGKGNSSLPSSETQNVLHVDGGTVRATTGTGNYFSGPGGALYVNLKEGGLTFDTNGNDVTISNGAGFAGVGGLTKVGEGILTLSGVSAFTGATVIAEGSLLIMDTGALGGSESLTMESGTALQMLSNTALNDNIQLSLNEGVTVDFLGTGLEVVGGLEIDGVTLGQGIYDITYLQTNFGSAVTFTGDLATGFEVIPEPGTVGLLVAGGFGLLIATRRRRRA